MNSTKELYENIDYHLLNDDVPSKYLSRAMEKQKFKIYPFSMLQELRFTGQSPRYHPEGNVWNHTLLVVDQAAKLKLESKNPRVLMWAALLHDIGKPSTSKIRKGGMTSYNHDKVGAKLSRDLLLMFTDEIFADKVFLLVKFHMQILFVVNKLPFADIKGIKQQADIEELALLGLCDRLGRLGTEKSDEENNIKLFIKICSENERK